MGASHSLDEMLTALKRASAVLRDAEIPFLLGGSFAAWALGGPPPQKDLDFMVRPVDADRALEAFGAAGMQTEHPPEEWLYKAWCDGVMIDLIFSPSGLDLDKDVFERAQHIPVMAVTTRVMAIDDVLVTKLSALNEHALDFTSLLGITRALREQVGWRALEARTGHSPYARAFFTLVRELGVAPADPAHVPSAVAQQPARVRVLPAIERG
jgi:putative nucleotidyltransferase-like protein